MEMCDFVSLKFINSRFSILFNGLKKTMKLQCDPVSIEHKLQPCVAMETSVCSWRTSTKERTRPGFAIPKRGFHIHTQL